MSSAHKLVNKYLFSNYDESFNYQFFSDTLMFIKYVCAQFCIFLIRRSENQKVVKMTEVVRENRLEAVNSELRSKSRIDMLHIKLDSIIDHSMLMGISMLISSKQESNFQMIWIVLYYFTLSL